MTPGATIHPIRSTLIAALAVLTLTACGSIVDDAKTEKELREQIPEITGVDMPIESVSCPDDQDFTEGATFTCRYTVEDGSEGSARVTITSEEGDGEVEYSLARFARGQMEQDLLESTKSDVPLADVTCPDTIEDGTVCTFEDEEGDTGKISLAFDAEDSYETSAEYD